MIIVRDTPQSHSIQFFCLFFSRKSIMNLTQNQNLVDQTQKVDRSSYDSNVFYWESQDVYKLYF